MGQMTEEHFAVLRRQMVEVIAISTELASEELGKAALDRVMAASVERYEQTVWTIQRPCQKRVQM